MGILPSQRRTHVLYPNQAPLLGTTWHAEPHSSQQGWVTGLEVQQNSTVVTAAHSGDSSVPDGLWDGSAIQRQKGWAFQTGAGPGGARSAWGGLASRPREVGVLRSGVREPEAGQSVSGTGGALQGCPRRGDRIKCVLKVGSWQLHQD